MKRRILKTCERCRQEFICGLFGCWCAEIPITDQQYASIIERYHECLCSACLAELSGRPIPPDVLKQSSPTADR